MSDSKKFRGGPKILILDIETAPLIAHVWGLWENNVGLNQIVRDWHMLSWCAKWLEPGPYTKNDNNVMFKSQQGKRKMSDDKAIIKEIRDLLDEADIVLTQNGISFDNKKINAKCLEYGIKPPSSFRHLDTKVIFQRHFNLPSYKLEYLTEKFNKKFKKLKHKEFPGHEMWVECLKDNSKAWAAMEKYNKYDVLALEELWHVVSAWDTSINFAWYSNEIEDTCSCGSHKFLPKEKYHYTNAGKYQKYVCAECGREVRSKLNLFSKEKRASLKNSSPRG